MDKKPKLTPEQIERLARHLFKMQHEIEKFYENPDNYKQYIEWYKNKYDTELKD